jgi:hypothetical protein
VALHASAPNPHSAANASLEPTRYGAKRLAPTLDATGRKTVSSKFSRRDLRTFSVWLLILNSPVLLSLVPISAVKMISFLPMLFWVSIPGIPLSWVRFPGMRLSEFGANPEGALAWAMIVLFWVIVAAGISLWARKRRAVAGGI